MSKEKIQAKPEDIVNLLYEVYNVPSGICKQIKNMVQRLEAIDNSKPSDVSLIWLNQRITRLEDDLQHYTMVEKDKALASITEKELNHLTSIKNYILKSQEQEKENNNLKGQVKYLTEVVTEFQKIFKAIFEKNVSIFWIKECESLEEYNYNVADYMKLTQEEYDLLKRYFNEQNNK